MKDRKRAAKLRWETHAYQVCPTCGSRALADKEVVRARKGGHASYLKSLEVGQPSMSERGKRGGRPKKGTLVPNFEGDGLVTTNEGPESIPAPVP